MPNPRTGFRRTGNLVVKAETRAWLEGIAETFEDQMPLGDLLDLLVDHARTNDLEDAIFGPAADEEGEPIAGDPPNALSELRTQTEDREANEDEGAPEDEESEENERPRPRRSAGGGMSLG